MHQTGPQLGEAEISPVEPRLFGRWLLGPRGRSYMKKLSRGFSPCRLECRFFKG